MKVSKKIQGKIENIIALKDKIIKWETLEKYEIQLVIKQFEKVPRDEVSNEYVAYLNDPSLGRALVEIAKSYNDDFRLISDIISSLGYLIIRYQLEETNEMYQLMLKYKDEKKGAVGVHVSFFLRDLAHFDNYVDKWKYYLSIKDLIPSKIAERVFLDVIRDKVEEIPLEYRNEIIRFIQSNCQHEDDLEYLVKKIEKKTNKIT
ncbi:hypothetical protein [Myroides sp. DF42-4-2]|uniref:hypothetical protein n=1 Tax=Myroides sp. DF42-4-2 TaxID=2746726 RepID=UPI002576DBF5|nr:hypothetical protein [Myroides sp. DF42-4-2]MDM1409036.1 hypothetical protein [Myroides sp. DF42-4-2]